jgi:hypothetical protein
VHPHRQDKVLAEDFVLLDDVVDPHRQDFILAEDTRFFV